MDIGSRPFQSVAPLLLLGQTKWVVVDDDDDDDDDDNDDDNDDDDDDDDDGDLIQTPKQPTNFLTSCSCARAFCTCQS